MRYVLNNYVCKLEWAIEEFWGFNATLSVEIMLRLCKTKYNWIKMSFWCLQISQKTNKKISRISALASKKRSNYKK